MRREYYSDTIAGFLASDPRSVLGEHHDQTYDYLTRVGFQRF